MRQLEPAPVAPPATGTSTGPAYQQHRVFVPTTAWTSPADSSDGIDSFSVAAPGPLGQDMSALPVGGIDITKLIAVPTASRPPHPPTPAVTPAGPIRVSTGAQMAKLIKKVIPDYPPLAKTARISGVVHLLGVIARDGTIQNLQLISGHPLLAHAAMEAVGQWIYQPTLLNGEPVEVIAPIDVNFTLGQ